MAKLPTDLSGRALGVVLEKVGFEFRSQRGSHRIYRRDDPRARVVVPDHSVLKPGTLRSILREAGVSVEELLRLLG